VGKASAKFAALASEPNSDIIGLPVFAEIDKGGRRSEALLHGWEQCLATGQNLCIRILAKKRSGLTYRFR
jgi:hypothetical protein